MHKACSPTPEHVEESTVLEIRSLLTLLMLSEAVLHTGSDLQAGQIEGGGGRPRTPGCARAAVSITTAFAKQDAADVMPSSIELIVFLFHMLLLHSPETPADRCPSGGATELAIKSRWNIFALCLL